jgi:phage shock protein PspC (stress-responsive transcriptional regulator)
MNQNHQLIKRLYRCRHEPLVGGVCAGIAEYAHIDPTIVRIIWVIFTLLSMGMGLIAYLIAWIIIPEEPKLQKH